MVKIDKQVNSKFKAEISNFEKNLLKKAYEIINHLDNNAANRLIILKPNSNSRDLDKFIQQSLNLLNSIKNKVSIETNTNLNELHGLLVELQNNLTNKSVEVNQLFENFLKFQITIVLDYMGINKEQVVFWENYVGGSTVTLNGSYLIDSLNQIIYKHDIEKSYVLKKSLNEQDIMDGAHESFFAVKTGILSIFLRGLKISNLKGFVTNRLYYSGKDLLKENNIRDSKTEYENLDEEGVSLNNIENIPDDVTPEDSVIKNEEDDLREQVYAKQKAILNHIICQNSKLALVKEALEAQVIEFKGRFSEKILDQYSELMSDLQIYGKNNLTKKLKTRFRWFYDSVQQKNPSLKLSFEEWLDNILSLELAA